ncbi:hypothetical protein M2138_000169 [Dysgonomonadaceae bacterium PH5-43]|nr:hypothetical protein [Dysgonomonadaceae bacterium PH5-43]
MGKIFYHNISREQLNETDRIDLMDMYTDGDLLYKSEAGNALLYEVSKEEIIQLKKDHEEYY